MSLFTARLETCACGSSSGRYGTARRCFSREGKVAAQERTVVWFFSVVRLSVSLARLAFGPGVLASVPVIPSARRTETTDVPQRSGAGQRATNTCLPILSHSRKTVPGHLLVKMGSVRKAATLSHHSWRSLGCCLTSWSWLFCYSLPDSGDLFSTFPRSVT